MSMNDGMMQQMQELRNKMQTEAILDICLPRCSTAPDSKV
jgi:hypothetical protein